MDDATEQQLARLRSIDSERPAAHNEDEQLIEHWQQLCRDAAPSTTTDFPNYWKASPSTLICNSNIHERIRFSTGSGIFNFVAGAIGEATDEVILITCFWARSKTLDDINKALRKISATPRPGNRKVRVRIYFSSLSVFQKLFHTSSAKGHVYSPSQWKSKLGLPDPTELTGLDLEVKSIFFRPFSVLHPKFVIIDRRWVHLPSCNVSWENWLEGCITMSGNNIVAQFTRFWLSVWASEADQQTRLYTEEVDVKNWTPHPDQAQLTTSSVPANGIFQSVQTFFLPSPHHRNPHFSWPWSICRPPPQTPLNLFLLTIFNNAQHKIYIQTPNLTSPPVLSALTDALQRGVDVQIVTCERLMILEQLVTAGTTTCRTMSRLKAMHRSLLASYKSQSIADTALLEATAGTKKPGRLEIAFYRSCLENWLRDEKAEPMQSHVKLTVVDERWTVLGSGNMDRASWFTSQELGVAFYSQPYAKHVMKQLGKFMELRMYPYYSSEELE